MSDEWCPEHDGSHCAELRRLEQRIARLEAPERAILLDLLAELRSPGLDAYLARDAADRAEARLREVTGDE